VADLLIGHIESSDFAKALQLFAESRDAFDMWFKERMAHVTGVYLNIERAASSYSA
jgi:hypothetical protein